MVIGSGPIIIGQAAEFDYAGSQACKALKEQGLEVVLVNSNPATLMTDHAMADQIYIEPLNIETIERIIIKEKPDSILSSLGGQTGLTLCMELAKSGFLQEHGVKLLGANPETIDKAEDRQMFKDTMESIGEPCIPSKVVTTYEDAYDFVKNQIGYPAIIRPAFTLGGTGGGIVHNDEEMDEIAHNGLHRSPIHQILVEKCISGWKEVEFEVMRDSAGNVLTVCSMENFDPVGVHTGDSIVIAPTVTLSDKEYQMLRSAALNIISSLGMEGGCNCQFALNPNTFEYAVIEVNPRVSRSSALASKATGYPIAKVATLIAIGYTLDEIPNAVTKKTAACFEPVLDYVVVKMPKFPFEKFVYAKRDLGTQMKATGEVMAIGHNFETAIMKAARGAEVGVQSLNLPVFEELDDAEIEKRVGQCTDQRIFAIFQAIKRSILSIEQIHEITKIDLWFLAKLQNLAEMEKRRAPIDFFSWHIYARNPHQIIERSEQVKALLSENNWQINWEKSPLEFAEMLIQAAQKYHNQEQKRQELSFKLQTDKAHHESVATVIASIIQLMPSWGSYVPTTASNIDNLLNKANEIENQVTLLLAQLKSTEDSISTNQGELKNFFAQNNTLNTERLILLNRYSAEEISKEEGLLQKSRDAVTSQKSLLENEQKRYEEHQQTKPMLDEIDNIDTLNAQIADYEKQVGEFREKKGAIDQELALDNEKKKQLSSLKEDADKKHADFNKWSRLNYYIGDNTGKKFRKIAQSYVLSSLIHSANRYMKTLTDRYTLKVTPGTFVISTVDAYQGYVSRATSTISGGESFLVSLSLALALSDIGENLSTDMLFIDEGFGTLSGEPLQRAINTLRSLHNQAGRRVGIISHVEELRERIPVQIQVNQEGNSSCSHINIVSENVR